MYEYLIALGSSIEPRHQHMTDCLLCIEESLGRITGTSSFHKTPPFGPNAKQEFLNGATLVLSTLAPPEMMNGLLAVEKRLGRTRELHWADRSIDCDIILARKDGEALIVCEQDLTIPHPLCHIRDFVLIPCCEIAGAWTHPGLQKSMTELLFDLEEKGG